MSLITRPAPAISEPPELRRVGKVTTSPGAVGGDCATDASAKVGRGSTDGTVPFETFPLVFISGDQNGFFDSLVTA